MAPTATGSKACWALLARRVGAGAGLQRAAHTGVGAYRGGLPLTAFYFRSCSVCDFEIHEIYSAVHYYYK